MRITWQIAVLAILVVVVGAGLALQRQANMGLRSEIDLLREQNREVDRLRAKGRRLSRTRVSALELERLRADHAAVARLRDEIEVVKARIIEMERAESAAAPHN